MADDPQWATDSPQNPPSDQTVNPVCSRTRLFSFRNTRISSDRFMPLRRPVVRIQQRENTRSTKACEAGAHFLSPVQSVPVCSGYCSSPRNEARPQNHQQTTKCQWTCSGYQQKIRGCAASFEVLQSTVPTVIWWSSSFQYFWAILARLFSFQFLLVLRSVILVFISFSFFWLLLVLVFIL